MRFGKTPLVALVAAGLLGTLGFGGLLFSITDHSTQAVVTDNAGHAVVAGLARDGTGVPPTPTPSPTPTPPPAATPRSLAGLRVWAGGDSVGAFVTESFVNDMVAAGADPDCTAIENSPGEAANTCYFWKISTGLSRPDYFDWMAKLQQAADDYAPNVMLFMVGGNDGQALLNADGSGTGQAPFSDAWDAAYAQRVSRAMDIMTADGRYAIWVGMPIMLDTNEYPGYDANIQKLNAIYQAQAAAHARVAYIDAYSLLSGPDGKWAEYLPDIHGVVQQMRASDGVHLTTQGGEFLAQHAIQALQALMQQ